MGVCRMLATAALMSAAVGRAPRDLDPAGAWPGVAAAPALARPEGEASEGAAPLVVDGNWEVLRRLLPRGSSCRLAGVVVGKAARPAAGGAPRSVVTRCGED